VLTRKKKLLSFNLNVITQHSGMPTVEKVRMMNSYINYAIYVLLVVLHVGVLL